MPPFSLLYLPLCILSKMGTRYHCIFVQYSTSELFLTMLWAKCIYAIFATQPGQAIRGLSKSGGAS
jgi:hypothetical protein